ncbi:unnamed protein product [Calypogeia fissa]
MSRHTAASHYHKSKTLNDKYLLGDEIGKGAYGRVYKGLDLENGDFVAIKQVSLENIPPEDLASIMQEIDLLKNLNHKNIVKYQGSFKTKSHLYIILEYVENGSLANIIKPNKFGAFPESLVAVYIAQVLEGLVYLHEQGVIHRDIKGANILTTKEGLVKLADFGVATKLTEADVNTHSVVGTPYWMAPEVIEMSGVSAASDIWSVGCTVIELLTCVPPYYDLQPMPALFRIVQDEHPPLPEHISAAITDFLHQCFRKDAKMRPDARTLLKHPWIRNSSRTLKNSLQRTGGRINNIPEDVSTVVERAIEDGEKEDRRPVSDEASTTRDPFESGSDDEQKTPSSSQSLETSGLSSSQSNSFGRRARIKIPRSVTSLQRMAMRNGSGQPSPSSGSHQLPPNSGDRLTSSNNPLSDGPSSSLRSPGSGSGSPGLPGLSERFVGDVALQGSDEVENLDSRDQSSGKGFQLSQEASGSASAYLEHADEVLNGSRAAYSEGLKQKSSLPVQLLANGSNHSSQVGTPSTPTSMRRLSDMPVNGQIDDALIEPFMALSSTLGDMAVNSSPGAGTQGSASKGSTSHPPLESVGAMSLAVKLRAKTAQRVDGEAAGPPRRDLFQTMIDIVEGDDNIDITNIGFENREEGRDYLAKQAMEITRLVSLLKPDESEDAVISACQKLVGIFRDYPEQKAHLISQHGIIPLVEMLDVSNNRVLHSVLQLLNQIIEDNVSFQENACLVGLIPMIMNFAAPERSREMRMQAAAFIQQICLTSSLTLQMFIACRGLPVLVSLLEPDYTKYREMVHVAIDAIWQVFGLQNTTARNDFCRIFAKSGVLVRLVNTLYSLNEATRVASAKNLGGASSGMLPSTSAGSGQVLLRSRSGPLEQSRTPPVEAFKPRSGQLDPSRVRAGYMEPHRQITGLIETHRPKSPQAHKSAGLPEYLRHLPGQHDQRRGSIASTEPARAGTSLEGGREIPWQSPARSLQFSADRDLTAGQMESGSESEPSKQPMSTTENSRAPFTDQSWHTGRTANGFVDPGHQDVQVQPLFSLLEKEPPSRPGQPDYYRHGSSGSFDRHENSLPLLHHAAVIRKMNGKMDGPGTGYTGTQSHSTVSPSHSATHKSSHNMGSSSSYSDGAPSTSGPLSQRNSGPLSSSGTPNGRLPSTSGTLSQRDSGQLSSSGAPNGRIPSTSGPLSQRDSGQLSTSGAPNDRRGSGSSPVLLSRMVSNLNADVTRDYVVKVADLLLEFSRADTVVKSHMCSVNLLIRLFQMLNKLEPVILLKILRCIKELSTDPFTLEYLQRADAMKHLVPFLNRREGPYVSQIHNQVLNALYNLCKINKRRQEQAAESGIIPHLMHFIKENSPLKQFALPLLCDMAHASRYTREQLRAHKGLDVYLSLLNDEYWAVTALDSLAVCLAHDNDQRKVEQALLKKDALQKLVAFFQSCSGPSFVHILEPFLKIITKSVRLNTELAVSGLTPLLVARLDHQDAIARLNLLKLIKAVYEHHPRPKQLIVEHDLPQKLRELIEDRNGERSGGQVLVKQMATALLKALHINTVL